jgi:CHAD domain-containing protein/CYTH domain-containing protein
VTPPREKLLDLPVGAAAAHIAESLLADGRRALERMKDRRDTEALHDFRVAVRRLRSIVRAYRPWLGRAASRKIRACLRTLGAVTNTGRDAEVQVAWLEASRTGLSRSERSGLNWLLRRLRATRRSGYESARRHAREDFENIAETLTGRLQARIETEPTMREVFAGLLADHVDDFESHLSVLRGNREREAVHAMRIRAKRLRYLLEIWRSEVDGVRELLRPLKGIQTLLGELHDMHVLDDELGRALDEVAMTKAHRLRELSMRGEHAALRRERRRDERLGLIALAARMGERQDELLQQFEKTWLHDRGPALVRDARALAARFRPDAIPRERERKYLLSALPPRAVGAPVKEIEQGWLPGQKLRERLRRVRSGDGVKFFRTIKLGSGVERIEIEEETTREVFDAMWPLTAGCRIVKRRHVVEDGGVVWEIDEFLDRDLVLAEIELESAEQPIAMPSWLELFVAREVTDDPAYLNLSLASRTA